MAESLPPLTPNDFELALTNSNSNFKTALVFGKGSDKAWKVGKAAQRFLPGVRTDLARSEVAAELRETLAIPRPHVGVVFTLDGQVPATLAKGKSKDFLSVAEAIAEACPMERTTCLPRGLAAAAPVGDQVEIQVNRRTRTALGTGRTSPRTPPRRTSPPPTLLVGRGLPHLKGPNSGQVRSGAAVPLGWHDYERGNPSSTWNWLDPGSAGA